MSGRALGRVLAEAWVACSSVQTLPSPSLNLGILQSPPRSGYRWSSPWNNFSFPFCLCQNLLLVFLGKLSIWGFGEQL